MPFTMRIEQLALWTADLARVRDFYVTYFDAVAGAGYRNPAKGFESVFLSFGDGARLEFDPDGNRIEITV